MQFLLKNISISFIPKPIIFPGTQEQVAHTEHAEDPLHTRNRMWSMKREEVSASTHIIILNRIFQF